MRTRRTGRSHCSPGPAPSHHRSRHPRTITLIVLALAATLGGTLHPARAQAPANAPDLTALRDAAREWNRRSGPERQIVDMVCLVPDTATFLSAIATWDEHHYFPILIDDVEYTFKFLQAFHPARIVRFPRAAPTGEVARAPATPDDLWKRAVAAVGRSWTRPGAAAPLPGDAVPQPLGPTPPGVVFSSPESQALAGAVALAAGRFQPLVRWQTTKKFADVLTLDEARALDRELEGLIAMVVPDHDRLGDGCDFVTLAGDYPYRYIEKDRRTGAEGRNAFDDLILRGLGGMRRWAYAGRLMGDPVRSVYRAMCSLFLTPSTGIAFNTYDEAGPPWSDYVMTGAAARLNQVFPTQHVHGHRASLAGWHESFDPVNRQGLALINTHGGATSFHLQAGPGGHTSDIPESAPTAVIIIHSFSAESPADPQTLAGRWLANGAFVYFGAEYEPYLQSFRTPELVAALLTENVPVVAAVRKIPPEIFSQPWRLVYLGDAVWQIKPPASASHRLDTWAPVASWPAYGVFAQPEASASDSVRLKWTLKMSISNLQSGVVVRQRAEVVRALLGIARERLDPGLQPIYDDLLVDSLLSPYRLGELLDRLTHVPPAARSADLLRHLETAQTVALQRARAASDFGQAAALWSDVIRAPGSSDFARVFTERVAPLADAPAHLTEWRDRLRTARRNGADPSNLPVIDAELKRVEELIAKIRS